MTGHDPTEPRRDELERGQHALSELAVEPLPPDVLARLEGRLEGELGRPEPRPAHRRRRPRLAFAIPGAGVALAAAVAVAVLATNGGRSAPAQRESAISMSAKAVPPTAPTAAASGAADSSAPAAKLAAQVRVPALVGHGLGYLDSVTAARGLSWTELEGSTCPRAPGVRVRRQVPPAGAMVVSGSTIRVACVRYGSGS